MKDILPALPENPNSEKLFLPERLHEIVLAAGSFWSAQSFFSRIPGVSVCTAGYANGRLKNANFKLVDRGDTGFAFSVLVQFDYYELSLSKLLTIFFSVIDPLADGHQGNDYGTQYRTGIYYLDPADVPIISSVYDEQRRRYSGRIATEFKKLENFIEAEDEQQYFLETHEDAYRTIDFSLLAKIEEEFSENSCKVPGAATFFSDNTKSETEDKTENEAQRIPSKS